MGPVIEPLTADDVPAIVALHREALAHSGHPGQVRERSADDFRRAIGEGGAIYGIRDTLHQRLVAFGTLLFAMEPGYVTSGLQHIGADQAVAVLAGSAIALDQRGRGLHRLLSRHRLTAAALFDIPYAVATAAPDNFASWRNLVSAGLSITALSECHGGLLRYVHAGSTAEAPQFDPVAAQWVPAGDHALQSRLLACGHIGWLWRRGEEGSVEIAFSRPTDAQQESRLLEAGVQAG